MEEVKLVQGTLYFYWDIFLLLNFIMNLFLVGMTGVLRRKNVVKKRMLLAAFLGSVGMTIGMLIPYLFFEKRVTELYRPDAFQFLEAVIIAFMMLEITFRERMFRELLMDFWGMVQVSVVTGGCLFFIREHVSWFKSLSGKEVFAGTAVVYLIFLTALHFFGRQEQQKHVLDGILSDVNGKEYSIRVLYDTGNRLVSPYTGEAVMVISQQMIEQLDVIKNQMPLWIPYHSIGGDGMLPTYRLPKITLQNGEIRENFLAASSEKLSADDTIQIIWNG